MDDVLPNDIQTGLDLARARQKRLQNTLRIQHDGAGLEVLRRWPTGFAVAREDATRLRGRVDLFDGPRHLYHCLVVLSAEEGDEMHFEFKRVTPVLDRAPLDFEERAPLGLIEDNR